MLDNVGSFTSNIASNATNSICDVGSEFNDIKIRNRQKRDLLVNAFNSKYERKGHLFEGPFKAIYVEDDIQY